MVVESALSVSLSAVLLSLQAVIEIAASAITKIFFICAVFNVVQFWIPVIEKQDHGVQLGVQHKILVSLLCSIGN